MLGDCLLNRYEFVLKAGLEILPKQEGESARGELKIIADID